ncbi:hypothetical protein BASA61_005462 [Batrachochytrium salamandrivorans]|nr:hypothetical protein BASA61_005462 [Batrachochytrium salamandrivorans]
MLKNIDSSIEAFFSAPIGTKINIGIDVTLDSALGHDFLYLSVKSSDVLTTSSPALRASEQFSVALRFTSDGIREFTGATIKSFTVSAA